MKSIYLSLACLMASPAWAALEIRVTGGEATALPVAIVPFSDPVGLDEDLAAVVERDLRYSGLFLPLPRQDMLERPSDVAQVDYRNWRALAIDYVVVGQIRQNPGGRTSVRFQLLDVLRAQQLLGYDIPIPDRRRLRSVGHQIADMIYEKLTGSPGYFNSQIAYVSVTGDVKNRLHQIVIADSDGENPVVVATSRDPLMSPVWSPDRRQLAYVGFERGQSAIYIHTLATGELRKIVSELGINGAPAWSPDGRRLAVTLSFEKNPDIYIIDIATGSRKQLTTHFAIDTEPTWSPDGREIAFTSDRGGQPQIYVMSANGGDVRRLTYEGRQNLRARYSPDGKRMVLVNYGESGYRIGVLELETRELRIVSEGPLDESPSFAPNGAVIIYAAQGRQGAELATVTIDGRVRQRLSQSGDVRDPAWSPVIR
jgi:TolB protein